MKYVLQCPKFHHKISQGELSTVRMYIQKMSFNIVVSENYWGAGTMTQTIQKTYCFSQLGLLLLDTTGWLKYTDIDFL